MQRKPSNPPELPKLYRAGMWMFSSAMAMMISAPLMLILKMLSGHNEMAIKLLARDSGAFIFVCFCCGPSLLFMGSILGVIGKKSNQFFSGKAVREFYYLLTLWTIWSFTVCPLLVRAALKLAEKEHIRGAVEGALSSNSWPAVLTLVICFVSLTHIWFYWNYYRKKKMLPAGETK